MSDLSRCDDLQSQLATDLNRSVTAPLSTQVEGPFCTPLLDSALLRVSGADWRRFLQGQLTCNIDEASPGQALAGAYCTPKGRMVANFTLICAADDSSAWLRLPVDQAAALRDALQKYAVFFKVALELETGWCGIGIQLGASILPDAGAASFAGEAGSHGVGTLPPPWAALQPGARLGCGQSQQARLIQLDDHGQRFELWVPSGEFTSSWDQLQRTLPPAIPDSWQLLDIRAGLGQVVAATRELFLPQMLNLELLGAVSFRKGCYTGQEVVARLHYRGKSKRRMHRIEGPMTDRAALPAPGASVHNDRGQAQGEIVTAVAVDADRFEALAVLAENQLEGALTVGGDQPVRLLSLPYAITSDSENQ